MDTSQGNFTSRETCKICYRPNAVGFRVPDEVWRQAVPEPKQNTVVCLACFTMLADERGVEWDADIDFYPVSFVRHREWSTGAGTNAIHLNR